MSPPCLHMDCGISNIRCQVSSIQDCFLFKFAGVPVCRKDGRTIPTKQILTSELVSTVELAEEADSIALEKKIRSLKKKIRQCDVIQVTEMIFLFNDCSPVNSFIGPQAKVNKGTNLCLEEQDKMNKLPSW